MSIQHNLGGVCDKTSRSKPNRRVVSRLDIKTANAYSVQGEEDMKEYYDYDGSITIPSAEGEVTFKCEQLFWSNPGALLEAAVSGSESMRLAAIRRVVKSGDETLLRHLVILSGRISASIMNEHHELYSDEVLADVLITNKLSLTDYPDIAFRLTHQIGSYTAPLGPNLKSWLQMGRPRLNLSSCTSNDATAITHLQRKESLGIDLNYFLEAADPATLYCVRFSLPLTNVPLIDVLLACITRVSSAMKRWPTSMLLSQDVERLSALFSAEESSISSVLDVLTLTAPNDQSRVQFNAVWSVENAPWLVLSSPLDIQLGMLLDSRSFEIFARHATSQALSKIEKYIDPIRASLLPVFRLHEDERVRL